MRALNGAYLLAVLLAGTASTGSSRLVHNSPLSGLSLRGNLQQDEILLSVQHFQVCATITVVSMAHRF